MALYITLFTKSKHMTSKLSYLIWSPVSTLYAGNVCVTMRPFWCLRQISLHFKTWAFIQSPSKKVWCLYEPYACTQRAAFYLVLLCTKQGSRLTFQLASPVATDRFDLLAKTNFLLARHSQFCYGNVNKKSSQTDKYKVFSALILTELPELEWCRCLSKYWFTIFTNKILCSILALDVANIGINIIIGVASVSNSHQTSKLAAKKQVSICDFSWTK